jgi:predicted MFS family arabinose efflux permease
VVIAFGLLALGGSRPLLIASALLFGTGFGSAYPAFLGHVLKFVDEHRRGAAFGSIIGMFDTGIGTGSIAMGWLVEHFGYRAAWGTAAILAACSIPYFILVERRVLQLPQEPRVVTPAEQT